MDQKEKQVKAYGFMVHPAFMMPFTKKGKQLVEALKEVGDNKYLGVTPDYPRGLIISCRTENDAKEVRNILRFKGIAIISEIREVFIDKQYLEGKGRENN